MISSASADHVEARHSLTFLTDLLTETHESLDASKSALSVSSAQLDTLSTYCESLEALFSRIDSIEAYVHDVDARTLALQAVCDRQLEPAPLAKLKGLFNRFTRTEAPQVPSRTTPLDPDDYKFPHITSAVPTAAPLPTPTAPPAAPPRVVTGRKSATADPSRPSAALPGSAAVTAAADAEDPTAPPALGGGDTALAGGGEAAGDAEARASDAASSGSSAAPVGGDAESDDDEGGVIVGKSRGK